LPERSHPDYGRLYREKLKDKLAADRKAKYRADPNRYKKPYDPVAAAEYRKSNPKRFREHNWRRHGIVDMTYELYLDELKRLSNKCQICDNVMELPQVDHDHSTGKYRGLLCKRCNFGLGVYEAHKERFEKYLIEHNMRNT
jgi:hypothetical protein